MKTLNKLALAGAIFSASIAATPVMAESGLSANVGAVSDYYFRGANLGDAGVYAGVDYTAGGFYAGTWWIDVGSAGNDGLETDFYLGYGLELDGGITLGVGYSRYEYSYTSDFEQEFNFTAGVAGFGLEYTTGSDDDGAADTDYDYLALSWGGDVFGATVGMFENDDTKDAYDHVEFSASGEVSGVDATFSVGKTFNVEAAGVDADSGDGYMVLDVSKSFDL